MSFQTGITNINNMAPELPVQASEDLLSTPMFNLIHSFGVDMHHADAYIGKTTRMSRFERLSTDGGQLDGSGIDPASEVPQRTDIDATMEIYAKSIVTNEQVVLWENSKTLTKFTALLGQWLREKEDLLMRDLFASSVSYINATGGTNGDQPSNITLVDINNIERILLNNDARTMLTNIESQNKFNVGPVRDAFIALANTNLTSDLQAVGSVGGVGVIMKAAYPSQEGLRPEEYCSISRFRFFVSSKGAKTPGISTLGRTVYTIPMYGLEAAAKVEQNSYTAQIGYRPPWVVSSVAQNSQLYAKFAIARAITNQNWISGLNVTTTIAS
jgi:N4-gp56 family major capsid protein